MAHLVTKLASQKRWEQLEVLPDAEQGSEQDGAQKLQPTRVSG